MTGTRTYEAADVIDVLEAALESGTLDETKLLAGGARTNCHDGGQSTATFNVQSGKTVNVGNLKTSVESGDCVWSFEASGCSGTMNCSLPHYVDSSLKPISESQVS